MRYTSITLDSDDFIDLSETIISYLKMKEMKEIVVEVKTELEKSKKKIFNYKEFDQLQLLLSNWIEDEGIYFRIKTPFLKTSFEKFSYGIELNSIQNDIKEYFSNYIID